MPAWIRMGRDGPAGTGAASTGCWTAGRQTHCRRLARRDSGCWQWMARPLRCDDRGYPAFWLFPSHAIRDQHTTCATEAGLDPSSPRRASVLGIAR